MKLLVYCRHTKIEPTSNSVNCSAYTFHVNIKKKKNISTQYDCYVKSADVTDKIHLISVNSS